MIQETIAFLEKSRPNWRYELRDNDFCASAHGAIPSTSATATEQLITHEMKREMRAYEVRPRKDKRGVDLISDVLPFGGLW
jgi:hypothetical protein